MNTTSWTRCVAFKRGQNSPSLGAGCFWRLASLGGEEPHRFAELGVVVAEYLAQAAP